MMQRRTTWSGLLLSAALGMLWPGCENQSGESFGGETHWLVACSNDRDCGAGSCKCNICTLECQATSQCGPVGANVGCALSNTSAFAEQCSSNPAGGHGLCLRHCSGDVDCNATQHCTNGFCVDAPQTFGDAGVNGDAGSAGDAGSSSATTATLDDFVNAYCTMVRSCCQKAAFSLDPLADCETELVRQWNVLSLAKTGTVKVDGAQLATCVTNLQAGANSCQPSDAFPCAMPFVGTLPLGASCTHADECERPADGSPVACVIITQPTAGASSQPTGICRLPPRAASGQGCQTNCASGDPNCGFTLTTNAVNPALGLCYEEDGLYCKSSATEYACAPLTAEGNACLSRQECGSKLICSTTCTQGKGVGEPCADWSECRVGLTCGSSNSCESVPLTTAKLCGGDYA